MKKVLVTGATGFVGNYVIKELLSRGHAVVATSVSLEKAKEFEWLSKVTYIPFDFRNYSEANNYFELFLKPDILIHLAWEGLPNYKEVFHVEDNLPRHYAFLKNLIDHGLKDITVTGTCFEYGMQEGQLSEDMPVYPANPYAIAKNKLRLQLEELTLQQQIIFKWVRLFYMYGNGQSPKSLLSQVEAAITRGDQSFNMSPGDQLRDYLPVEKVAEFVVTIALQQKVNGIINCCSGNPISVRDLVLDYLKKKNANLSLNLGYYPYPDIEPRHFWGDNQKLKTILINEGSDK